MPKNILYLTISDYFERDAIGLFVTGIRQRMRRKGIRCEIFAERHGVGLEVAGNYADCLGRIGPNDILLHQLSNGEPELAALLGVPCKKIIFYHNITPPEYFQELDPSVSEILQSGLNDLPMLEQSDAVYANSRWTLDGISQYAAKSSKTGVMPPINLDRLEELAKLSESSMPLIDKPYLLVVGRVLPHKNVSGALEIFSALKKMMPNCHYVIAGGSFGNYMEKIRATAEELDLSSRLLIMDSIDDSTLASLIGHAQMLVSTSLHEGFCVPLVEAMACGTPIAIAPQPAMFETVGASALVLDGNVAENALKLEGVLKNSVSQAALLEKGQKRLNEIVSAYKNSGLWELITPA